MCLSASSFRFQLQRVRRKGEKSGACVFCEWRTALKTLSAEIKVALSRQRQLVLLVCPVVDCAHQRPAALGRLTTHSPTPSSHAGRQNLEDDPPPGSRASGVRQAVEKATQQNVEHGARVNYCGGRQFPKNEKERTRGDSNDYLARACPVQKV